MTKVEVNQNSPRFVVRMIYALYFLLVVSFIQCESYSLPPSEIHPSHFNPYNFGYDVDDSHGTRTWRSESSHNPMEVHGSYGYRDKNGVYREVIYVADKDGFRANIKTNEPGLAGSKDPSGVRMESFAQPQTIAHTSTAPNKYIHPGAGYYKSQIYI